ncbi:EcoRII N-terminal effector-binding domain-containing protein, partial [Escherichia coli]
MRQKAASSLTLQQCQNYFVYIKRLSANDTGATGGHQVGLY